MAFLRKMFTPEAEPKLVEKKVVPEEKPVAIRSSQTNIFQRLKIKPAAINEAIQSKALEAKATPAPADTTTARPLAPKR